MGMPLRQWDVEIAPILQDIEAQAGWATVHAERVSSLVRMLRMVPDFDTNAKDEMEKAVMRLKNATMALSDAISMYESLPVDE